MIIVAVIIVIILFLYWQDNDIMITDVPYKNSKIPKQFENYKVLQISDLHDKKFGKDQKSIMKHIEAIKPDMIVITGDLIDKRRTTIHNIQPAITLLNKIKDIAPVYYVKGNHENSTKIYPVLEKELLENNAVVLNDQGVEIKRGEDTINLIGMDDLIAEKRLQNPKGDRFDFESTLASIRQGMPDRFTVLLSHRPELIDIYSNQKIDMALCGHAHGGQIRLPFVGALYAPDQGFFPKYASGVYQLGSTSMIVSRGLGNSLLPARVFNRPELVVVTLHRD
jgi:predicted MPP superfamily phosphohydrolase